MTKFIIKRVLISIVILFFVMFLVYLLMSNLPFSFIDQKALQLSQAQGATKSREEWIADLNAQFGLDKGPVNGYFTWLKSFIKGDFGDSWKYNVKVSDKFQEVIWRSFALSLISFILQIIIAVPLGVVAARKQYSPVDYTVTVVSLIGISLPTFFVAELLKLAFSTKLGWFPLNGLVDPRLTDPTAWQHFWDMAYHMFLPATTLTIVSIGSLMRYTRTNMLEVLNADYIRTARAKGVSESKVIGYHAFRNTLIPLVTILGGSLPGLFSGAMITEQLFSVPGIGYISYQAMVAGDIPFTMFYLAFLSVLTLLGNLISDILYAVVDPRVRVN